MKLIDKYANSLVALALVMTILFSACQKPAKTYSNDFNAVKAETYRNLTFAPDVFFSEHATPAEYHTITLVNSEFLSPQKSYDDFMSDLQYFFPNKTLDPKTIFYRTLPDPNDPDMEVYDLLIADDRDKLIAGEIPYQFFMLDTSGAVQDYADWKGSNGNEFYYLKLPNALVGRMDKGNIYNKYFSDPDIPRDEMVSIAAWTIGSSAEPYKILPPDSTESYKMFDGKNLSIADGVKTVKEFFANIPAYTGKPLSVAAVDNVKVYKMKDDTFCYEYKISDEYDGIPFDYGNPGGRSQFDYNFSIHTAEVCKSGDVDMFIGISTHCDVKVTDSYKNIIPVGQAVAIASEEMTKEVKFEVRGVELLFCAKNIPDSTNQTAAPAWRIICFNPNDNLIYHVYMDAKDGANFRYYTTSADE